MLFPEIDYFFPDLHKYSLFVVYLHGPYQPVSYLTCRKVNTFPFHSFQVINHGMTCSFLDQVRKICRQFFDLPAEEKHKYARQENDIEGYGTDMVLFEKQILDWTDRLYLQTCPEEHQKLEFWPQKPESFRLVCCFPKLRYA